MNTGALEGALALLALCFVWSVLYQNYMLDRLRQRIFAIRDELFDYAASGAVRFDDPAYRLLRGVMNSSIRFAHRMNMMDVFLTSRVMSRYPDVEDGRSDWAELLGSKPERVSARLLEFEARLYRTILEHVVLTSAIMLALLGAFVCAHVTRRLVRRGLDYCRSMLEDFSTPQVVTLGSIIVATMVPHTPTLKRGVDVILNEAFSDAERQQHQSRMRDGFLDPATQVP